jgi:hypothetical protein
MYHLSIYNFLSWFFLLANLLLIALVLHGYSDLDSSCNYFIIQNVRELAAQTHYH